MKGENWSAGRKLLSHQLTISDEVERASGAAMLRNMLLSVTFTRCSAWVEFLTHSALLSHAFISQSSSQGSPTNIASSELNHRLSSYTQTSSLAEPPIGSLIDSLVQNDSLSSDVGGLSFQIQVL